MRLDIGWLDLVAGLFFACQPGNQRNNLEITRRAWGSRDDCLTVLSVRSAFDLLLRSLALPPGSEVLMSALTVPDMVHIVRSHGLVPVPIDTDAQGHLDSTSLRKAISANSRVVVVAHLFGGTTPMDEVLKVAKQHGLLVVEDSAQAFRKAGESGHPSSDVAMFSFGPIKTATALGGAVVRVSCPELRERMSQRLRDDPIQSRGSFAKRVIRFAFIKGLCGRRIAAGFRYWVERFGYDFDTLANSFARGFGGGDLLKQIRQQPSTPLLRMLRRRWKRYDDARIERRIKSGKSLDEHLAFTRDACHSYWIYPIFVDDPEFVCQRLREIGYDATHRSRMTVVPPTVDVAARKAQDHWRRVVFLPWYAELPESAVHEMAKALERWIGESRPIPGRTDSPRIATEPTLATDQQ